MDREVDVMSPFDYENLYLHSLNAPSGSKILKKCMEVAEMLIDKNISYGDSALSPIKVFSTSDDIEGLNVRIDDKLTRIKNSQGFPGDNDIKDMIGYLILLDIGLDNNRKKVV
jgi:hypothetical protein